MKRARNRRVRLPTGLETSFVLDCLEASLDQKRDKAIQVRLRVGEERRIFIVVSINNEGLGSRDEPEINPVAQCSLKECPNLLLSRDLNGRLPLEGRRHGLASQKRVQVFRLKHHRVYCDSGALDLLTPGDDSCNKRLEILQRCQKCLLKSPRNFPEVLERARRCGNRHISKGERYHAGLSPGAGLLMAVCIRFNLSVFTWDFAA